MPRLFHQFENRLKLLEARICDVSPSRPHSIYTNAMDYGEPKVVVGQRKTILFYLPQTLNNNRHLTGSVCLSHNLDQHMSWKVWASMVPAFKKGWEICPVFGLFGQILELVERFFLWQVLCNIYVCEPYFLITESGEHRIIL